MRICEPKDISEELQERETTTTKKENMKERLKDMEDRMI